jgi:hypothetical protein
VTTSDCQLVAHCIVSCIATGKRLTWQGNTGGSDYFSQDNLVIGEIFVLAICIEGEDSMSLSKARAAQSDDGTCVLRDYHLLSFSKGGSLRSASLSLHRYG